MVQSHIESRRAFLGKIASAGTASILSIESMRSHAKWMQISDFPLVDLHVHLDDSTIDRVLDLSKERGIKFGIVEHAGSKENVYPTILTNDAEMNRYLAILDGRPVYKGIQAEWTDWMRCFSPTTLARLDFVLTDAWTFPDEDGKRTKLWEPGVEERLDFSEKEKFMDRFVDWHVQIMTEQPIDIMANVSWLPAPLAADFDRYWTVARMEKLIAAAMRNQVALEISGSLKLPKIGFLKRAKEAGIKFTFGSNGRYPDMGKIDYCIAMAHELKLKREDMFLPLSDGLKAVQRRKY